MENHTWTLGIYQGSQGIHYGSQVGGMRVCKVRPPPSNVGTCGRPRDGLRGLGFRGLGFRVSRGTKIVTYFLCGDL